MFQKFKILLFITFFHSFFTGYTQTPNEGKDLYANMPYSRISLGEIAPFGNLKNVGMGGTGVSYGDPGFINSANPALLINNRVRGYDSLLTILDASALGQFRKISSNNASEVSGNVNFNSFAYAIPVSKRWTTCFGLRPYSSVSYNLFSKEPVSGSPTDTSMTTYDGYGGIYQVDFSNGVRIHKNLNIGLQASYLFGKINHESFTQIYTLSDPIRVGAHNKISNSGLLFRPGVAYRKKMNQGVSVDSSIFINLGLTYEFFGNFQQDQTLSLETRSSNNIITSQSTVESNKINVGSPQIFRLGISFDKYKKWNIAADFSYSDWSSFKGYSQKDTLKGSFTLALGGELAFNTKKGLNERDANFKKKFIRGGVSYTKTPMYIRGRSINDFSASLGYSFPVGSSKNNYSGLPMPLLTTAIVIGQRGTLEDNLVKDVYYKIYLGLTINDKWFRRRRVD